jgi:hypothetical protein
VLELELGLELELELELVLELELGLELALALEHQPPATGELPPPPLPHRLCHSQTTDSKCHRGFGYR